MNKRKPSKLKPEKIKELTETKIELQKLEALITEILNGNMSQTDVAKKLNLTIQSFHNDNHLQRQISRITHFNESNIREILYACRTPYEKLIYAIFGLEKDIILILPEDINEKLEHLMQEKLNDQEYTVICSLFGIPDQNEKSLEQVGKQYNRTRERIRQIQNKALRKLRRPALYKQMLENYDVYIQSLQDLPSLAKTKMEMEEICQQTIQTKNEIEKLTNTIKTEKDTIQACIKSSSTPLSVPEEKTLSDYTILLSKEELTVLKQLNINTVKDLKHITDYQLAICLEKIPHLKSLYTITNLTYPNDTAQVLLMSIQELNCSVRLFNALYRNGWYTLGTIIQHTPEEVQNIRNIGHNCYNELLQILKHLGLHLKTN